MAGSACTQLFTLIPRIDLSPSENAADQNQPDHSHICLNEAAT